MNKPNKTVCPILLEAFRLMRPAIAGLIKEGRPNQTDWAIALYSGRMGSLSEPLTSIQESHFQVIYSGDPTKFAKPYHEIALSKAWLTAALGKSTWELQAGYPERVREFGIQTGVRCTHYFGSATNGIDTVAFSGADPNIDELIAALVLRTKRGLQQQRSGRTLGTPHDTKDGFYVL